MDELRRGDFRTHRFTGELMLLTRQSTRGSWKLRLLDGSEIADLATEDWVHRWTRPFWACPGTTLLWSRTDRVPKVLALDIHDNDIVDWNTMYVVKTFLNCLDKDALYAY